MKIAHYSCVFPPYNGGIGRVAFEYCRALTNLGHEVTAVYPRFKDARDPLVNQSFRLDQRSPYLRYGHGAVLGGLFSDLAHYDVIHLHYPFFGTAEALAIAHFLRHSKCKLFLHYHMDTPALSGIAAYIARPARALFPFIFSQSTAVTSASLDYLASSYIGGIFHKHHDRFFEVPFGVTDRFLAPIQQCQPSAEKKFIFVGGMDTSHAFKGVRVLLKALSLLADKRFSLSLVGEGNLRSGYEAYAKELGIADSVFFLGPLDDNALLCELDNHSALVLPSTSSNEAFGLVLIEAMSRARAVIASDLCGVRSVFRDGQDGFLFEAGNSQMLADKMNLLGDLDLAQKMGLSGHAYFSGRYGWSLAAKKLSAIYSNSI